LSPEDPLARHPEVLASTSFLPRHRSFTASVRRAVDLALDVGQRLDDLTPCDVAVLVQPDIIPRHHVLIAPDHAVALQGSFNALVTTSAALNSGLQILRCRRSKRCLILQLNLSVKPRSCGAGLVDSTLSERRRI